MLPLAGTTCIVYGSGAIDPELKKSIGTTHRLSVCVNRAPQIHNINPDVLLWIDPDIWESHKNYSTISKSQCLCICDSSVPGPLSGITLPLFRGGLPECLNPNRLYHYPNTAVVAALWAMSIGCGLVGMVGCNCEEDHHSHAQLRSMTRARDLILREYNDVRLIASMADWTAFKYEGSGMTRLYRPCTINKLREFYVGFNRKGQS